MSQPSLILFLLVVGHHCSFITMGSFELAIMAQQPRLLLHSLIKSGYLSSCQGLKSNPFVIMFCNPLNIDYYVYVELLRIYFCLD